MGRPGLAVPGGLCTAGFSFNALCTKGAGCQRDTREAPAGKVSLLINHVFLLLRPPPSEKKKSMKENFKKGKEGEKEPKAAKRLDVRRAALRAPERGGGCQGAGPRGNEDWPASQTPPPERMVSLGKERKAGSPGITTFSTRLLKGHDLCGKTRDPRKQGVPPGGGVRLLHPDARPSATAQTPAFVHIPTPARRLVFVGTPRKANPPVLPPWLSGCALPGADWGEEPPVTIAAQGAPVRATWAHSWRRVNSTCTSVPKRRWSARLVAFPCHSGIWLTPRVFGRPSNHVVTCDAILPQRGRDVTGA